MKILEFIAEITHGESYRPSKVELDAENSSAQIYKSLGLVGGNLIA